MMRWSALVPVLLVLCGFLTPLATIRSDGTRQRFSALSGDDVLRMLVAGYPPARGGGGMPQRIIVISSSPPELRTTGAGSETRPASVRGCRHSG